MSTISTEQLKAAYVGLLDAVSVAKEVILEELQERLGTDEVAEFLEQING